MTTTTWSIDIVDGMAAIPAADWDACARAGNPFADNPFVAHAFLSALEDSGAVDAAAGWLPRHLVLREAGGAMAGVMPLYLKGHSLGEYVFDHAWADAYMRIGERYYPKLLSAVPFTPVTGPRLLVAPGMDPARVQTALLQGAVKLATENEISSLHVNFPLADEWRFMGEAGFLQRIDTQFHWLNEGYATFEAFLDSLASRKRKAIRRERKEALSAGVEVEVATGGNLREAHWDAFYRFYLDTGSRKWGRPYLNRKFFSLLGERMADSVVLMLARRNGRYIAGALNLQGGGVLYGRNWGAIEHHPFLHFELCYYQAIDYGIAHGLTRVEAGAQGEHKLARGYLPAKTYSAHWFRDDRLRNAVARFLVQERRAVESGQDVLADYAPFRKG